MGSWQVVRSDGSMQLPKVWLAIKTALEYRYLPAVLAFVACIIMLPALKAGLLMDDFVQRLVLVKPSQLPERLYETGHVPDNPGTLSAAVFDLFGFNRSSQKMKQYRNYGLLPWWVHKDLRVSLWRPLTALTHWLDYQLFPNSPAFMHAHNILWFSAVIFLVAIVYRQLMPVTWLAGLAALLYLLDESTYFPVMFIANRGFIVSIFFAVLTILAHHWWRRARSLAAAIGAQFLLLLSLLSNEAGVTTFAYLLAYELVLDESRWTRRALSIVPAVSVIILWRIVYEALGYGVFGSGLYLDPLNEPLTYSLTLFERVPLLLTGQLAFQAIDLVLAVSESIRTQALLFSVAFLVILLFVLFPLLRRNRLTRFWFAATIFSVIPIATVGLGSKNLAFVAIAAFGLISVFVGALINKDSYLPNSRIWRVPAYVICIIFLIVHIPIATAGRVLMPKMTSFFMDTLKPANIGPTCALDNKDVIVINACPLSLIFVPFNNAYYGKPIPKSLRTLAPGYRPLVCTRFDESALMLKSYGGNFFCCEQKSPLHLVYLLERFNIFREKHFRFQQGNKIILSALTIEVLEVDRDGMPTEVLFNFGTALENPDFCWLQFNWETGSYSPFEVPAIGKTVEIAGPVPVSLRDAIKFLIHNLFAK